MFEQTYTEKMIELYKEETGETQVDVFEYEMWLFEKELEI